MNEIELKKRPEGAADIARLLYDGMSAADWKRAISREYGVSVQTAKNWMDKFGVKTGKMAMDDPKNAWLSLRIRELEMENTRLWYEWEDLNDELIGAGEENAELKKEIARLKSEEYIKRLSGM